LLPSDKNRLIDISISLVSFYSLSPCPSLPCSSILYTPGEEIKVHDRKPTGLGCKTAFQSNRKAVKLKKQCFAAFMSVLPETNF
jgi:hypothetical protein